MALAVNQTEEKELNWADFIDGLRYGVMQRVASKRGAQPESPKPAAPPDNPALDPNATRGAPESYSN
jgi:hypothetical protein